MPVPGAEFAEVDGDPGVPFFFFLVVDVFFPDDRLKEAFKVGVPLEALGPYQGALVFVVFLDP